MKQLFFNQIIKKYREFNKRDCLDELFQQFPDVPFETLQSIVLQERQRKTKKTFHIHSAPDQVATYYKRYLEKVPKSYGKCGFLLEMADEVELCPALMAKLIMEHHYKINILPKEAEEKENVTRHKISSMLKDTSTIPDPDLAAEIRLCTLADEVYGSVSDIIKTTVGLEYEVRLKEELTKLGISFIDEKILREKGYDKTPDVKLDTPIVIDGHIVNWVESKASFGDEDRHKEYLRDQYWCYCNRFGPGLVIYWFGYIEELDCNKEQGILIKDFLPDKVTFMDPTLLMKKIDDIRFS